MQGAGSITGKQRQVSVCVILLVEQLTHSPLLPARSCFVVRGFEVPWNFGSFPSFTGYRDGGGGLFLDIKYLRGFDCLCFLFFSRVGRKAFLFYFYLFDNVRYADTHTHRVLDPFYSLIPSSSLTEPLFFQMPPPVPLGNFSFLFDPLSLIIFSCMSANGGYFLEHDTLSPSIPLTAPVRGKGRPWVSRDDKTWDV